jgi:hypothetical protein
MGSSEPLANGYGVFSRLVGEGRCRGKKQTVSFCCDYCGRDGTPNLTWTLNVGRGKAQAQIGG